MAENTSIEWCDASFNPWWGCQKVSPACDHCYAERDAKWFAPGKVLWGAGSQRRLFDDKHWQAPLKWAKKLPAKLGRRPRVFSASMADWLDLDAPIGEFVRLLDTVRLTPELDWLLLSKRVGNWRKRLEEAATHQLANTLANIGDPARDALWQWIKAWLDDRAPANVWLGATVVNQAEADRDIPKLLAVQACVRFLSIEPMLGPIALRQCWLGDLSLCVDCDHRNDCACPPAGNRLHWLIAGGESGPGARPSHPDWYRSLRDQCEAAGVPFLFKQWGEWARGADLPDHIGGSTYCDFDGALTHDNERVWKVGKKAAGRLLDGRTHDGFPVVVA